MFVLIFQLLASIIRTLASISININLNNNSISSNNNNNSFSSRAWTSSLRSADLSDFSEDSEEIFSEISTISELPTEEEQVFRYYLKSNLNWRGAMV